MKLRNDRNRVQGVTPTFGEEYSLPGQNSRVPPDTAYLTAVADPVATAPSFPEITGLEGQERVADRACHMRAGVFRSRSKLTFSAL